MIELNKIYNEDCLEGMKRIPDGSVDCIVCDLPYEVLNKGNEKARWDNIIPMEPLFKDYWRIAKTNAPIILFGQGMFTAQLMMAEPDTWRYNLIWQKDRPTGFLNAKRMPLRSHEDIAVFYRALPTYNPQMRQGIPSHSRGHKHGKAKGNVCYGNYNIETYSKEVTTEKYPISVLFFDKEKNLDMHPTQKPVALIQLWQLCVRSATSLALSSTRSITTRLVSASSWSKRSSRCSDNSKFKIQNSKFA